MSFLEKYNIINQNEKNFLSVMKEFLFENSIFDVGVKEMAVLEAIGEKTMPIGRLTVLVPAVGNPSFTLKKLEKKGYIEKVLSSHDDRVRMVKATEKGQMVWKNLQKNRESFYD